ncbi:MAG TPA: altronate dehydratase family protein [Caulobacterales bacterium]|nr:altronate dehydratase family protein [Caulobacterales bacterium]
MLAPAPTRTLFRVHPDDDVAVALGEIASGEQASFGDGALRAREAIPTGHKIALRDLGPGEDVKKYGFVIGRAKVAIAAGAHVHTHNLATALNGERQFTYAPTAPRAAHMASAETFLGYGRADGRYGVRNEIWLAPSVGCSARTTEKLARLASERFAGRVDGVQALAHAEGCSQLGDDLDRTRRLLAALCRHPNAGGVLVLGLGCESNQAGKLVEAAGGESERLRWFNAQAVEDEMEAGLAAIEALVALAEKDRREPAPVSALTIGVKCGGSDAFSGLTANPLVGDIADWVTDRGGAAVLTEVPEMFGAEHLLMARAETREVFDALAALSNSFRRYYLDHGHPVSENPSPGNIAGGITTLEEKSLGAVQKGGSAIVTDVIGYGERVRKAGLTILEAPGNDGISSTALAASGAQIILFTTGRGTPLGFPAPTIKLSSNSELARRKPHWIDFDAGDVLLGSREDEARRLRDLVLAVASGQRTCNERNGEREIAIWRGGVTL